MRVGYSYFHANSVSCAVGPLSYRLYNLFHSCAFLVAARG